jgi:hypothetical protein
VPAAVPFGSTRAHRDGRAHVALPLAVPAVAGPYAWFIAPLLVPWRPVVIAIVGLREGRGRRAQCRGREDEAQDCLAMHGDLLLEL